MEPKEYEKIFVEQVENLLQTGAAKSKVEVAKKVGWHDTSLISAMKFKRPVPVEVYKKLAKAYNLDLPTPEEAEHGGAQDFDRLKDKYIAVLEETKGGANLGVLQKDVASLGSMVRALLEITLVQTEQSQKKSVYTKTVEIIKRHGLEGTLL